MIDLILSKIKHSERTIMNSIGVLVFLIAFGLYPILWWNDFQYLSISGLLFLFFFVKTAIGDGATMRLYRHDLWLVGFVIYGLITAFWAKDIALVWPYAFIWLFSLVLIIFLRDLFESEDRQVKAHRFFEILFFVVSAQSVLAIAVGLDVMTWTKTLMGNPNYTASYLVCLLPFVLYSSWTPSRAISVLIKTAAILIVVFVAYIKGTVGASLGLITLILITAFYHFRKYAIPLAVCMLIASVLFYYLFSVQIHELIQSKMNDGRLYSIITSWRVFKEFPILGTGLNHWVIYNYSDDLSSVSPLNLPHAFLRYKCHTYPLTLLIENGLVGFGLLMMYLIRSTFSYLTKISQPSSLRTPIFISSLVFILLTCYYTVIIHDEYSFSGIQCVFLIFLALAKGHTLNISQSRLKLLFAATSAILFIWYGYKGFTDYKDMKYRQAYQSKKYEVAKKHLNDIYNPILHTHRQVTQPILYNLAMIEIRQKNIKKAQNLLEKYIQINPSHGPSNLELAKIYFEENNDIIAAKELATKMFDIQNTNCRLNKLLVEIAVEEGNKEKAEFYFSYFIQGTKHPYGRNFNYYTPILKEKIEKM